MKEELKKSLHEALGSLGKEHNVDLSKARIEVKENKEKKFGDFSSYLADSVDFSSTTSVSSAFASTASSAIIEELSSSFTVDSVGC